MVRRCSAVDARIQPVHVPQAPRNAAHQQLHRARRQRRGGRTAQDPPPVRQRPGNARLFGDTGLQQHLPQAGPGRLGCMEKMVDDQKYDVLEADDVGRVATPWSEAKPVTYRL